MATHKIRKLMAKQQRMVTNIRLKITFMSFRTRGGSLPRLHENINNALK